MYFGPVSPLQDSSYPLIGPVHYLSSKAAYNQTGIRSCVRRRHAYGSLIRNERDFLNVNHPQRYIRYIGSHSLQMSHVTIMQLTFCRRVPQANKANLVSWCFFLPIVVVVVSILKVAKVTWSLGLSDERGWLFKLCRIGTLCTLLLKKKKKKKI